MTRPDHTAVPPADVIAAAEMKPCPFCGGAARIQSNRDWHRLYADHDEGCVFDADDHVLMYPAQAGYLVQIAEDWNRRAEGAAPTAAQAAGRSVAYRCPSGCGCLWRDNNDGTMSLLDGRQKSCPVCERMPLRELEPMAIADHLFIDCRDDGVWLVCVEKIHRSEDEARSSCRQWKAAYGNASYAPHATLAANRGGESATSGATSEELADFLNVTLWLYRRLPQAYGHPPFVDHAVLKMAKWLGKDAPLAIEERAKLHAKPE
jgi:hypothetical protein